MTRRFRLARAGLSATACALAIAGVAAAPAASARPAARPGWHLKVVIQYLPASDRSQYTAVIASAWDTWFLGGSNVAGPGEPVVEVRTPNSWQSAELPAGLHGWIGAASASSPTDIWAVTHLGGTVLTWDGGAWSVVPNGGWPTAGAQFTGVTALRSDSVWLFGASTAGQRGAGTWAWNGISWTRAAAPADEVYQASADSRSDMWAVGAVRGSLTAVLHYDAAGWARVTARNLAGLRYTTVLAETSRNVWLAGSAGRGKPRLAHWNGRRWTRITVPGPAAPASLCPDGQGGLWVVPARGAANSVMLRYSRAGRWSAWPVSASPANRILACARVPGTAGVWGAGTQRTPSGSAAAAWAFGQVP